MIKCHKQPILHTLIHKIARKNCCYHTKNYANLRKLRDKDLTMFKKSREAFYRQTSRSRSLTGVQQGNRICGTISHLFLLINEFSSFHYYSPCVMYWLFTNEEFVSYSFASETITLKLYVNSGNKMYYIIYS